MITLLLSQLLSIRQSGARIIVTFLDNETLDLVLAETIQSHPMFTSPDYMWLSGVSCGARVRLSPAGEAVLRGCVVHMSPGPGRWIVSGEFLPTVLGGKPSRVCGSMWCVGQL
jgi:hypothetical protein